MEIRFFVRGAKSAGRAVAPEKLLQWRASIRENHTWPRSEALLARIVGPGLMKILKNNMAKRKKFPKKAKLITDGGFYKIVKLDKPVLKIHFPLFQRFQITAPEINYSALMSFEAIFSFERVYRGYAEYRQVDVILKK